MLHTIKSLFGVFALGRSLLLFCMVLSIAAPLTVLPAIAYAATAETSTTCAKQLKPSSLKPGENIIKAVFSSISAVLDKIGKAMYQGIVANPKFQNVVGVTLSLYVAVFGVMVMLNLAPLKMGDVVGRLIRVAIIYGLLYNGSLGWVMFDQYFSALFMGGMNELIFNFAVAAGVPVLPPVTTTGLGIGITPTLDVAAVSALYAPMNVIYQPFFMFAIIGMLFLNIVCTIMAFCMMWAFWDFTMMILGALITYVRAIVGLTFLFGIAPIFIIFLLFQHTRSLFIGWINQCVSFAIAPVLLFAFLSFYTVLLSNVLNGMFANVDFCWGKMQSVAGTTTDIGMWRPAMYVTNPSTGAKSWIQKNGDWMDPTQNPLAPPIPIVSILMFLMVCHLGKNFCNYIDDLAQKISSGIGPGVTTGEQMGQFINNKVTGGKGFTSLLGSGFKGQGSTVASSSTTGAAPSTIRPTAGGK